MTMKITIQPLPDPSPSWETFIVGTAHLLHPNVPRRASNGGCHTFEPSEAYFRDGLLPWGALGATPTLPKAVTYSK